MSCCSGQCCIKISKIILFLANGLSFILGALLIFLAVYSYQDEVDKTVMKVRNLRYSFGIGFGVALISLIGCTAACGPPGRKWTRSIYLLLLLVLVTCEVVVACIYFQFDSALNAAKDHGFDAKDHMDKISEKAVTLLHDQVGDLYQLGECSGGISLGPNLPGSKFPLHFTDITCENDKIQKAFKKLQGDNDIKDEASYNRYTDCLAHFAAEDKLEKPAPPKDQVFCSSEEQILDLGRQSMGGLVWILGGLAFLTFMLVVSTIVMTCYPMCCGRRVIYPGSNDGLEARAYRY